MATMNKLARGRTMNNNRELPEEIWMEILVYLKANDLQNYKIVSKLWRSLISYPTFINSHLSLLRSQQQPDEILITTLTSPKPSNLVRYIHYHYYSIVNSNKITMMRHKELQFPLYCNNQMGSKLVLCLQSSCEGLLLFQDKFDPIHLYISNPVTCMFKPLPPLIHPKSQCCFWSLVRDTRLNKYKVFGIKSSYSFVVLTLEEDTTSLSSSHWEICALTENYHLPRFSVLSQFLLFQNQELLWLTIDKYGEPAPDALDCYCIHSINIETLIFNKIKIPPYVAKVHENFSVDLSLKCKGARHLLSEVNGSLCLTFVSQSKLEMFILEDRLKCVWTKSHAIHLKSLLNRHYSLKTFFVDDICLVAMRGVDKSNLLDLVKVLIHREDQLLLYDLKSQECRKIEFLEKDQKLCRHYMFHSNSLVGWD